MNDVERLGEYIRGTCYTILTCCEILDLDEGEDWEDKLLDINIETCVGCGWWHESNELEWFDEFNGGLCDQCKKDEGLNDEA